MRVTFEFALNVTAEFLIDWHVLAIHSSHKSIYIHLRQCRCTHEMHAAHALQTYEFMNIRQFQIREGDRRSNEIYSARQTIATYWRICYHAPRHEFLTNFMKSGTREKFDIKTKHIDECNLIKVQLLLAVILKSIV